MSSNADHIGTFWEHLDELRSCLIRIAIAVIGLAFLIFFFKDDLFRIVLAPKSSDFVTYRLLHVSAFDIHLMNIGLTEQFMIHLKTAMYVGLLLASPYILYQIFRFVSPALYTNERKYAVGIVGSAYIMFMLGNLLNYFLIFPFTLKFLGTYQVSNDVANMLTLQSYMDTLFILSLMIGVVFELPVVTWILGKMGFIDKQMMQQYRKHAIVLILIIAAVITPTTDAFTLIIVSVPIWLLYELSVLIVK
ncbi:MAG: twin-arginine translocase subunit TatC [Prevotella sp.]|nr:twin-arginine translocase subunit TatC [Prevotella sp.]